MTPEEVLKAVPQSVRRTPGAGEHLADGAEELISGPPQTIANETFLPEYYFGGGRLEQVTLSLKGENDSYKAQLAFEGILPALRSKYGNEISTKEPNSGLLYLRQMTWLHDGTNITMMLLYITGANDPVLNIVYQRRVSTDAGHL